MENAATVKNDGTRQALERQAVQRFWRVISDGTEGGADARRAALPAQDREGDPGGWKC
jgi:hypothetical protein